jgi:hypothetical protein
VARLSLPCVPAGVVPFRAQATIAAGAGLLALDDGAGAAGEISLATATVVIRLLEPTLGLVPGSGLQQPSAAAAVCSWPIATK